jgi:predicted N-acetyltransferase YhbS
MGVEIRPMRLDDVPALMELKNQAGWNQVEADWRFFIRTYPRHCFAAEADGETVGSVTGINYENKISWIGMVIVREDQRGKGIAKMLMESALDSLKDCACVKLDATPAGQPVYEKLGFIPEWGLTRMTGPGLAASDENAPVSLVSEDDMVEICAADKRFFGADRSPVLRRLFLEYPRIALKVVRDGKIAGYCFGREGYKHRFAGPVVAESPKDALDLIKAASKGAASAALDIVDSRADLAALLEGAGFSRQRSLLRMFKGGNKYPADISRCVCAAGGEYG